MHCKNYVFIEMGEKYQIPCDIKPVLVVVFEAKDNGKTVRIKTRFTAYIL
jgi:hypothetical protein